MSAEATKNEILIYMPIYVAYLYDVYRISHNTLLCCFALSISVDDISGKASMHKNAVVNIFEGLHGEAAAVSEEDEGGLEGAKERAKAQIEKI